MSYILDALKKDQARQAGPGLKLGIQSSQPRPFPRWLGISLGLIMIANLALLVWLFVIPQLAEKEQPLPVEKSVTQTPPAAESIAEVVPTQAATTTPVTDTAPAPAPSPAPRPAPRRQPIESFELLELPPDQQALFNSFTYSTHIYTDDPQLCAIVIDGMRLTAGSSFKGLKVQRITEQGVVFEQQHNGRARHVAVSIMQQWGDG